MNNTRKELAALLGARQPNTPQKQAEQKKLLANAFPRKKLQEIIRWQAEQIMMLALEGKKLKRMVKRLGGVYHA